jgi:8-oxo-dGTP pyrophosphatase MutT (NUDIX family)
MQIERLKHMLSGPLPGEKAQALMAPSFRFEDMWTGDPSEALPSSVLILIFPKRGHWFVPFIQRSVYNGAHSGQISFPGGKCEKDDLDYLHTALRETEEEIGVASGIVNFLGALTPLYIPKSNFFVYPQVGWVNETPHFVPDPLEVSEIIEVSLESLLERENVKTFSYQANDTVISAPYYDANGKKIWGATAMILSEMLEVIKRL